MRDTLPNSYGDCGTDILTGIEKIRFLSGGMYGVVTGTGGNDNLTSTQHWSLIYGGDGNDIINSRDGYFDTLHGGAGNDTLNGVVNANNIIEGGADFDVVEYGGVHTGYDVRILSDGSIKLQDTLPNTHGNYGTDILTGIEKINFTSGGIYGVVTGTGGNDNLTSTQHWSLIYGGDGNDIINSRDGYFDTLHGGAGNDTLNGSSGNDIINGGRGADVLKGGTGMDSFVLDSVTDGVDTITDFNSTKSDLIKINATGFGGITNTNDFSFNSSDHTLSFKLNPIAILQGVTTFNVATDIVLF